MFLLVYLSILVYIIYMEKIIKSCLVCSKSFTPDKKSFYKDLKNAGKFCSNSCSAVFNNLVILCPNCHRLADRGKLTIFKTVQSMIDK